MSKSEFYPVLAPGFVLRRLEVPFVYDIPGDELYELDDEAFEFIKKCDGKTPFSRIIIEAGEGAQAAIEYMLNEGIILMQEFPQSRSIKAAQSPSTLPSLRYLLLNITNRCNLACKHCYIGKAGQEEMKHGVFEKAVSQFEDMGGLKLMISGGEPLLHSKFRELMDILSSYNLRVVLLSNGTLIDDETARKLSAYVHEVQVSIDGITSHDSLRGKGSFDKAMTGISALRNHGIPISIATMVHRYNTGEFDGMQKLFSDMDVVSWGVDVPCEVGNLSGNRDFILNAEEAAPFLEYGFGEGAHESTGNYTCGSHLCSVAVDGSVSRCGFFEDEPVGYVSELGSAWVKLCGNYLWTLDRLDCGDCSVINECRGGCRFRAKVYRGIMAPDPVMCHANRVSGYL
jgi:radical SAM protein with 4Fe4S-binding SPASM domain